jgi:hypothetical protein
VVAETGVRTTDPKSTGQMTADANLKLVTVMIDRVEGSNVKKAIEEVLAAIKPLRERGLRVRVTRT